MIVAERLGIGISEAPRFRLVAAALPGDHVGRDRPRASGKTDQRLGGIERALSPCAPSRKSDPAAPDKAVSWSSALSASGGVRRGPSPATKLKFWPSANGTIRMSEKRIAASSCGKALERLERDLGRGFADRRPDRGSRPCRREARDIRAGSARPGASSTSAAGRAARREARKATACRPAWSDGRAGLSATLFSPLYIFRRRLML